MRKSLLQWIFNDEYVNYESYLIYYVKFRTYIKKNFGLTHKNLLLYRRAVQFTLLGAIIGIFTDIFISISLGFSLGVLIGFYTETKRAKQGRVIGYNYKP